MSTMRVRVGTSGYSYKEWKGPFYPKERGSRGISRLHAEAFKTVEINNTFYRMPTAGGRRPLVNGEMPRGTAFAVKAPQRITHMREAEGRGRTR